MCKDAPPQYEPYGVEIVTSEKTLVRAGTDALVKVPHVNLHVKSDETEQVDPDTETLEDADEIARATMSMNISLALWVVLSVAILAVKWSTILALDIGWARTACVFTLSCVEAEGALVVATGAFFVDASIEPTLATLAICNVALYAFIAEALVSGFALMSLDLPSPDCYILPASAIALAAWNMFLVYVLICRHPILKTLYGLADTSKKTSTAKTKTQTV